MLCSGQLVNQLKPLVDAAKSRQHLARRCRSSLGRCKGQPSELPVGNSLGKVLETYLDHLQLQNELAIKWLMRLVRSLSIKSDSDG
jgi:hypothetical protein